MDGLGGKKRQRLTGVEKKKHLQTVSAQEEGEGAREKQTGLKQNNCRVQFPKESQFALPPFCPLPEFLQSAHYCNGEIQFEKDYCDIAQFN